ncbi:MAG: flagellar motor protein MotB [Acetobacteraceae bacterium]|jgi:chemotaxis protein MotB
MRSKGDKKGGAKVEIHIHKDEVIEDGHHGGAWKVAYADFVTAMMAFFLLMWLLNATTEDQRKGLADYFSPTSVLSHNSSGTGQPFGGRTAFSEGAMVSDLGAAQVTEGNHPQVDQVEEDESDVIAQPRPHRDDIPSKQADRQNQPASTAAGTQVAARAQPASSAQSPRPGVTQGATTAARQSDAQRSVTDAEVRAELERREKQTFEQAAAQIREAVRGDPELAELGRQLAIDMTPEGLRIQILDDDRQPMFPLGSSIPNDRARLLLQKVAPVLARLTQDISIAGHTDAAPFAGVGRTNWELSAERANATRRLLVEAGLQEPRIRSVTGNAERDPLVPADPLAAANRRIAIVVLRSVRSAQTDGSPTLTAPTQPAASVRGQTTAAPPLETH